MRATAQPGRFHIPSLDGLRAVAIAIVFLSHAGLARVVPGTFGVTIFFFLSGYLITTLLRLEQERTGRIDLAAFYRRRALRILPPLYLMLALASVLASGGMLPGGPPRLPPLLAQIFFVANIHELSGGGPILPGTNVLWSLAVEEHFYLAFPLLYVALQRLCPSRGRQIALMAGLCALVLAWRCVLVYRFGLGAPAGSPGWARLCHATDTRLDGILFGCMLALRGNPALDPCRGSSRLWTWLLCPASVAGLVLVLLVRDERFRETFRYTLQSLLLFPVFVTLVRFPAWGPARGLNRPAVAFIGVLSYGFYLGHALVIEVVHQLWSFTTETIAGQVAGYTLAGFVALGLAFVVHLGVERPLARRRRRRATTSVTVWSALPANRPGSEEAAA